MASPCRESARPLAAKTLATLANALLLLSLLPLCGGGRVDAADFSWISSGPASFGTPGAWSPSANAPPGLADQAIFNRVSTVEETPVNFSTSPTNSRLIVRDDKVGLNLAGNTYRLTSASDAAAGVVVAEQFGHIADLSVSAGRLESNYATFGLASGSDGLVNVVNSAVWTNSQSMFVGRGGVGELVVETGSQVTAGRITLGDQASAQGYVTVADVDSLLSSSQQLVVGASGYAEMYVYDGASVNSVGAAIGRDANSTGYVTLVGGSWRNQGNLDIGGGASAAGGRGDLVIDFGATVTTTGRTRVWDDGLLSIRGGTFVTGSLENFGGIEYIVGVLQLTNQDLVVGDSGVLGSVLALTPDMHTIVDRHTTVDANGHIAAIEGTFTSGTLTNNGRMSVVNGAMQFNGASTNSPTGRISIIDGTLATGRGAANRLTNQGRIDLLDAVVNGDLHNVAGATVTAGGAVAFNGRVTGDGQFASGGQVTFNERFEPGTAAAAMTFGGDVTFTAANTLVMQIGGPIAGAQFDQISVAGSVAFGGTLDIALIGGFLPVAGQSFDLIEYGVRGGMFAEVNLPPPPSSLAWSLDYGPNALVLSVNSTSIFGDLNGDGTVNRGDVAVLVGNYGLSSAATAAQGDLNGDGRISLADLIVLKSRLGSSGQSPAAVPEPSTCSLALVAASLVGFSRWRRRRQ
ncbi:MAG: dockerin type I domain-containing protein [Pirellulales bacterium]